jgi:PAS domain S-box-containing protein
MIAGGVIAVLLMACMAIRMRKMNRTLEGTVGQRTQEHETLARKLRHANAELNQILNSAADGIRLIDTSFNVLQVNETFAAMVGYSKEECLGRRCFEASPELCQNSECPLRRVLAGEERVEADLEKQRRDGSTFSCTVIARAYRGLDGQLLGIIEDYRDITQRKRAEGALRESNRKLTEALTTARNTSLQLEAAMGQLAAATRDAKAASQAKSEFLANMSHEIRTPIHGIVGLVELLQQTPLTDHQRKYLEMITGSTDSLLRVVNDILDVSKIESGRLELEEAAFDLRDCISDTLRIYAVGADRKGIEIVSHVPPNVPELLIGDATRLRQIVGNLVGNAVKFTRAGEIVVSVETESVSDEKCRLHIRVRDTGIGIPVNQQQIIFEAFRQADGSTTRRFGGTGLGLTICSRLLALMGGRIWVESQPGKGSVFHLTACFKRVQSPVGGLSQPRSPDLVGIPVLVVDDHALSRDVLSEVFRSWGMNPTAVGNGPSALATMNAAAKAGMPFRLVVLDLCMPGMDGLAVLQETRRHPELTKSAIIILSSADQRRELSRRGDLNSASCLLKPVKQSELWQSVIQAVGVTEQPEDAQAASGSSEPADGARPLRILLVEDNPVNREVLVSLLEREGHWVMPSCDGKDAVERMKRQGPRAFDLVFMDVQMPVMDGFEATQAIRKWEQEEASCHTPIIAMTANSMKGDREKCLKSGMDDYVAKPVAIRVLRETLAKWSVVTPSDAGGTSPSAGQPQPVPAASPAANVPTPPIDLAAALDNLDGDQGIFDRVLATFMTSVPTLIGEITDAFKNKDAVKLRVSAHGLKGAAANVCAEPARLAALRIEELATALQLGDVEQALANLDREWTRLKSFIDERQPTPVT